MTARVSVHVASRGRVAPGDFGIGAFDDVGVPVANVELAQRRRQRRDLADIADGIVVILSRGVFEGLPPYRNSPVRHRRGHWLAIASETV